MQIRKNKKKKKEYMNKQTNRRTDGRAINLRNLNLNAPGIFKKSSPVWKEERKFGGKTNKNYQFFF